MKRSRIWDWDCVGRRKIWGRFGIVFVEVRVVVAGQITHMKIATVSFFERIGDGGVRFIG